MKRLINDDSREVLQTLEADSLHAVITDPPYHLTSIVKRFGKTNSAPCQEGTDGAYARASKGFMGQEWDGGDIAFDPTFWVEVYRVLKPGGYLLAFGGCRTFHRMMVALEDAGFECRDTIMYMFASGFPKSHNVALGIDKLNGHANRGHAIATASTMQPNGTVLPSGGSLPAYAAHSEAAKPWEGFGTALKPSYEPICMFRKPLSESSVARNVLAHGTGALNIDACRIHSADSQGQEYTVKRLKPGAELEKTGGSWRSENGIEFEGHTKDGRWPANVILSCQCAIPHDADCPVALLDAQSGVTTSGKMAPGTIRSNRNGYSGAMPAIDTNGSPGDSGGASRFYYVAKPSRREKGEQNIHPTVKPVALMSYLCRLVCPPGGTILDPFMGSGTTGIGASLGGFDFIGIEREEKYFRIAEMRNGLWREYEDEPTSVPDSQGSLFTEAA